MVSEIVPGVEKREPFTKDSCRGVGGVFVTIRENFNISLRGFFKLIFRLLGEFPAIMIRDLTNELIMGWRRGDEDVRIWKLYRFKRSVSFL